MEVADQWRRHWAGTAEYGKVTEGGVTTRVARAVEVMQANAPGARVRVMRAAYHQTAGPGAPATSFLMHSSRRVISSGFNLLESPSFPSKPLEISSTPLDSLPERNSEANYEVTEPDDLDISEPSKWRGSTAGSSVRMPSEESSTASNASIIDLDLRHKNAFRKYSYDSENSDISFPRRSSRVSPLLESPEDLSTLKYKSLLTGSNDWNHRRKSYSFEDTSPLNETVLHNNDTLAMESSTDSGICKSTELVNDADDKYFDRRDKSYDKHEETFKDWLSKNRANSSFYKNNVRKPYREHDTVMEDPRESSVALKSTGRLTINVPIKVADDYDYKKSNTSDDSDRRAKKVEFCKTELHFAADSGKVNIIATDEKPPPANDFRKRRSAFVPIRGKFEEKPITLFGDPSKDLKIGVVSSDFSTITNGTSEFDENALATKSILKNKIPKPKPYLLGENMAFGHDGDREEAKQISYKPGSPVPDAVRLINRQLQSQRRYSDENTGLATEVIEPPCVKKNAYRTAHKGSSENDGLQSNSASEIDDSTDHDAERPVKNKITILQQSPVMGRSRTRQLRDNELTYFGVDSIPKMKTEAKPIKGYQPKIENSYDDIFQSVRLIQKVNSACNSEAESEEAPEYQNLPLKTNFGPVPIPRVRTKLDYQPQDVRILKPVIEQDNEENYTSRRSRHRRQEESMNTSRSISEPPKANRHKAKERSPRRYDHLRQRETEKRNPIPRFDENQEIENTIREQDKTKKRTESHVTRNKVKTEPLYVNLGAQEKLKNVETNTEPKHRSNQQRKPDIKTKTNKNLRKSEIIITDIEPLPVSQENYHKSLDIVHDQNKPEKVRAKHETVKESDKESLQKKQPIKEKSNRTQRTEKLCTPEYSTDTLKQKIRDSSNARRKLSYDKIEEKVPPHKSEAHRSRSSHRKSNVGGEEPYKETEALRKSKRVTTGDAEKVPAHHIRHSPKEKTSGTKELSIKSHNNVDTNSYDSYHTASTARIKERNSADRIPSATPVHNNTKRSHKSDQYVINYDDKNGTVSTVCKVKPSLGTDKQKAITNGVRGSPKDYKSKNRSPDRKTVRNAVPRSSLDSKRDELRR